MKPKKSVPALEMPKSKRLVFNLIITLIPLLFVIFFELILRVVGYGDNLNLFINHPDKDYKEYRIVNPIVGKKYFQKFEYSSPARDIFLKKKPKDCFRVFVVGSSSVIGFPYDNNLMFSRILHEKLMEAYPGKKIEMVNTAITAINSFTFLDYIPQILREEPDAILFYEGHNEFYGAFGVGSNEAATHNPLLINIHLKMMNLRVYQLTRNIISGVAARFSKVNTAAEKRGTLMTRIVKNADITYGSETYKKGIGYFEKNIGLILAMAKSKNVPVFISEVVGNIHDMKPFKSIGIDKLKPAIDYFEAAQQFEKQGNYSKAKENYILARDYDCIRFRASSDITTIIHNQAAKYGAHLVPSLELFEANSPNGMVGFNLITEHLHPNIEGYFLLAESFYNSLISSKLIGKEIYEFAPSAKAFKANYGYTELDSLIGLHRVNNLNYHWPFRDETNNYIDYRLIYKPVSFIDSIAFHVMADKVDNLTVAHLKLAKMYEDQHDYINAFREYNALTKINSYSPVYFRNAADCLLKLSDLPGAIKYFTRSLDYGEKSFYAQFRLGELYLIKNDVEKAIFYFEAALKHADKERLNILVKLYISYVYIKDQKNIDRINSEIQKLKPGQKIQVPVRKCTYTDYIPVQVNDYIVKVNELLKNLKVDEAEALLLESLTIKDTPIAHRRLGEIYFKKRDMQKALYNLRKVYNDFDSDPRYLHLMTLVYATAEKPNDSKMCLERLKLVDPNYPVLKQLEEFVH
jgi:tetratricopeptide (TPR) repeat protein